MLGDLIKQVEGTMKVGIGVGGKTRQGGYRKGKLKEIEQGRLRCSRVGDDKRCVSELFLFPVPFFLDPARLHPGNNLAGGRPAPVVIGGSALQAEDGPSGSYGNI